MSTPAQMTTIATYRIALLNNPPLAEPIAELIAEPIPGADRGHTAPVQPAYVTQSNS
jgi:hypothetical protein